MKKIFCLIMIICILVFTGCTSTSCSKTISVQEQNENNTSMFVIVEEVDYWYKVVYHKVTKVMYVISAGAYNHGTFTLLVNPDGSPMIYKEE